MNFTKISHLALGNLAKLVFVNFITQELKFCKFAQLAFVSVSLVRGKFERIESIHFTESLGLSLRWQLSSWRVLLKWCGEHSYPVIFEAQLKSRFSEGATKFEKKYPDLTWEIFSNFLALSEYIDFTCILKIAWVIRGIKWQNTKIPAAVNFGLLVVLSKLNEVI